MHWETTPEMASVLTVTCRAGMTREDTKSGLVLQAHAVTSKDFELELEERM